MIHQPLVSSLIYFFSTLGIIPNLDKTRDFRIAEDNFIIRGLSGERAGHVINSSGLLEAVSGDMTFDVSALT
ncbi:hypothetical protein GGR08_001636, partial [Bartonella fuyuanensis]